MLAQPVQKKEPVIAVMVEALIDKHAVPDLMALRTQTMCLVGFQTLTDTTTQAHYINSTNIHDMHSKKNVIEVKSWFCLRCK